MSPAKGKIRKEVSFFKKLLVLVGLRQSYFFSKNLLGMVMHPQLTTARILKRKDFIQAFLVFGLPFNLWLILLFSGFLIWFLLRPQGFLFLLGLIFLSLAGLFLFLLALYDFYWIIKYWRAANREN